MISGKEKTWILLPFAVFDTWSYLLPEQPVRYYVLQEGTFVTPRQNSHGVSNWRMQVFGARTMQRLKERMVYLLTVYLVGLYADCLIISSAVSLSEDRVRSGPCCSKKVDVRRGEALQDDWQTSEESHPHVNSSMTPERDGYLRAVWVVIVCIG